MSLLGVSQDRYKIVLKRTISVPIKAANIFIEVDTISYHPRYIRPFEPDLSDAKK